MSNANLSSPRFHEHQWVLLVGIDRYEDDGISNLRVCVNDVRAVYETLIATGYEPGQMRLLLSSSEPSPKPTRSEILSSLSSVAQAAGENDLLLFYFSGHGVVDSDRAYILPTDARYTMIPDTAVDIGRVKQIIQDSAAKAKVIVLDACHSGAQIGKAPLEMTEEFVRHVFKEAEGMAILASCRQREVSWEWPEKRQSAFTYYLVEGLRGSADFGEKGFVTVSDINRYLIDKVKNWAVQHGRMQTPTLQCAMSGEIILVTLASSRTQDHRQHTQDRRQQWINRLGFKRDPFRFKNGGTDPYLQEYFYSDMKHFYDILGDVSRPGTIFVFGPPGSGKSSLRNVITQLCRKERIFPVVYQDFGQLVCKHQEERVQAEDHVTQILKTALRTLVDLAEESDKEDVSSPETEENKIIRNQLWLYASEYEDEPLTRHTLEDLLKPELKAGEALPDDARELLSRFCRYVTKLFGYRLVYILVDPSDNIDPDEEIAWQVLEPLLSTRRLLELSEDNVAFKFFLSQEFRERARQIPWLEQEWSRRVYGLEWPDEELRALLQARLVQCSEGRYESLEQLSEEVEDLGDSVIRLSMGSPRELIVICDRLFSEHCRKWSPDDGEPLLITAQEANEALKPFEERHRESALEQLIAQGESESVEFKSTMRFNTHTQRKDSEMEREIARTLCAFVNTEGGTLIIGVGDDGTVLGLDDDFSTLGGAKTQDGFIRAFENITKDLFSSPVSPDYYTARFEEHRGKLVYVIEVQRSKKPAFCLFGGEKEFYIRKQTTTQKLDVEATLEYVLDHFKD